MKIFVKPTGILCILIVLSSCTVVKLNKNYKTPLRPFQYPRFSTADSLRGALNKYRTAYDVKFYELWVQFYPENKSITGRLRMISTANELVDTIQIDLYWNMQIDSIIGLNHKQLTYTRKYNAVFIALSDKIEKGKNFEINVYYRGKPLEARRPPWEGGFVWKKDKNKQLWAGVACEVAGSSLWWPSKDHLSDEPDSMVMHYTVPKPYFCAANGVLIDSIAHKNNITYTWKVSYPINTYNVTFYIGNFSRFTIPYSSDSSKFDMDFYVLKYNFDKAKEHFKQTSNIIWCYEKFYGAYPFPNDIFKLIESPYEGMEHQTAIAYGNRFRNLSYLGADYIILHEVAHEWWGNSVSVPDYAEIWIHEGFATYSEALFVEATQGYEAYLNFLRVYALFIKNKRPVVGPTNVNYWDYEDTDVYMKGALILHTLRNSIRNDSIFKDILRTFYQRYKYKIAVSKNFIDIVNEKTGKDYTPFFNQYLYNRSCPVLLWQYSYDIYNGKSYIYYQFDKANDDFSIPIQIKSGDKTYYIHPTSKVQKAEIPNSTSIIINYNNSYIAQKRVNKF